MNTSLAAQNNLNRDSDFIPVERTANKVSCGRV
jgi:hypothetical protein